MRCEDIGMRENLSNVELSILEDIFKLYNEALNDVDTLLRVSDTAGISVERVAALTSTAADLSMGMKPGIRSEQDVDKLIREKFDSARYSSNN